MKRGRTLITAFSTPTRRLIPVGNTVVADFSPVDSKLRLPRIKELRFLYHFRAYFSKIVESGMSLDEAVASSAADANVEVEWALKYLRSKRYREWIADHMAELETQLSITPGWIMRWHKANVEGLAKLSLSQQASLSELGDRLWPKVQKIEHDIEIQAPLSMDDLLNARRDADELEKKFQQALVTQAKENDDKTKSA